MRFHDDPVIDRIFRDIAEDNTSGASVLFQQTFALFPRMAELLEKQGKQQIKPFLQDIVRILVSLQPGMAPFVHLARYIENFVNGKFQKKVIINAFRAFPLAAERLIEKQKRSILKTASQELGNCRRLLTHSRSSLVERFLRSWLAEDEKREIFATESRPIREGIQLLEALQDLPNRKICLVDDARGLALTKVDAVVIGSDRICETKMLNKIGTYALAVLAREKGVPVYVLADGSKLIPTKMCRRKERMHPADEVINPRKGIKVMNYYFEEVPNDFFRFITADGVLDASEIRARFQQGKWEMFCFEEREG